MYDDLNGLEPASIKKRSRPMYSGLRKLRLGNTKEGDAHVF